MPADRADPTGEYLMTLEEILDKQNTIHQELERMNDNPDTTEESDGHLRDTLVDNWKTLDAERAKIVARMDELNLIRKAAADSTNRESGDGGTATRWTGGRGPEL